MEGGSEGESNKNANHSPSDGGHQKKPKRQMKTPFQLQTLEKVYASMCTSSLLPLNVCIYALFLLGVCFVPKEQSFGTYACSIVVILCCWFCLFLHAGTVMC